MLLSVYTAGLLRAGPGIVFFVVIPTASTDEILFESVVLCTFWFGFELGSIVVSPSVLPRRGRC